jgi:hypothetical protein
MKVDLQIYKFQPNTNVSSKYVTLNSKMLIFRDSLCKIFIYKDLINLL